MNRNNIHMSICGTNLKVLQEELSKNYICICEVMGWGGWVEKREGEMKKNIIQKIFHEM